MPREHRVTHPVIGMATWREIQGAQPKKHCLWCHQPIPQGRRTRCGKVLCNEMIWQAYSWQRVTKMVMRRDKRKCVLCGCEALEVDHIVPVSLGGSGDMDNLRSLCSGHHKAETKRLRQLGAAFIAVQTLEAPHADPR